MSSWTQAITEGARDAQQAGATVTVTGVNLNANNSTHYIGLGFPSCPIPRLSTINSATLAVNVTSGSFDDPDVEIYCEENTTPAAFAAVDNDISGRQLTTAFAPWDANGIGVGVKTSPDFAAALQEWVDSASYSAGQYLHVIVKGASGASLLRISSYEDGGNVPSITVDYTPPGSWLPARRRRTHIRM